jgi:hypothetical protein
VSEGILQTTPSRTPSDIIFIDELVMALFDLSGMQANA